MPGRRGSTIARALAVVVVTAVTCVACSDEPELSYPEDCAQVSSEWADSLGLRTVGMAVRLSEDSPGLWVVGTDTGAAWATTADPTLGGAREVQPLTPQAIDSTPAEMVTALEHEELPEASDDVVVFAQQCARSYLHDMRRSNPN